MERQSKANHKLDNPSLNNRLHVHYKHGIRYSFFGKIPLHLAVDQRNAEMVALLLALDIDPNICDSETNRPIEMAIYNGERENIPLLFDYTPSKRNSSEYFTFTKIAAMVRSKVTLRFFVGSLLSYFKMSESIKLLSHTLGLTAISNSVHLLIEILASGPIPFAFSEGHLRAHPDSAVELIRE